MKKQFFIGTATWLMTVAIFTSSAPLFAGREKDNVEEKVKANDNIIVDHSDGEEEDSPQRKKNKSNIPTLDSPKNSLKTSSSYETLSTDVSPEKEKISPEKTKNLSSRHDDTDVVGEGKPNRTRPKSLILLEDISDENIDTQQTSPFKWENLKEIEWENLEQVKGNKKTLYPDRKITEPEQHINFKDSFKKNDGESKWLCQSIYNQVCSLLRQVANSNVITGNEAGGRFHRNIENLVCETTLFDEWRFLDGPKVEKIFQGGKDSEYFPYQPCRTVFFKANDDKDKVALVGSSYTISHIKGESLDTIDRGKHIFQVLERLTASLPWVKKFLLPITIEVYTENKHQLSHQLLMELQIGEKPNLVIWDSLSELSTKDIKPIAEQVISEIALAQTKLTSRIEDEFEILRSETMNSKYLNLHDATMTYQPLRFQLPATGNCTRFALFFALLRSENEDLQKYTVDTANRFCTFVKKLDPR